MKTDLTNYIGRLKNQKEEALEFVMDEYFPLVKGIVTQILLPLAKRELAEECISDVFLSVWHNAQKFKGESEVDFRKWLCAIAKYRAIDFYRREKKRLEIPSSGKESMDMFPPEESAEEHVLVKESIREMEKLLNLFSPVVGDIFRFLNGGRSGFYDLYTESALDIDMVKADKGIEVTLNQGVYDGKTLSLTYTIKTAEDFGENLHLNSNLDVDFAEGTAGSERLKKVSPGVYVGQSNYTFFSEQENRDAISFRWSVSGLTNMDEGLGDDERKTTACRLNYSVSLKALDYKVLDVAENRDVAQQVAISLKHLSATPINTILYYAEEIPSDLVNSVQMVWEIKDDLGNVYAYNENIGQGRISGKMLKMEYVLTFNHLNPRAKTLFITPTLKLVHTQGGGVTIAENGEETPLVDKGLPAGMAPGEWTMKQVRIDISSLQ
ncbi:sigma-70 family RNA polymerase sigma factor [Desulfosporosinus shakirovi]|uniref:sigma-70 family RNA polymerase sigma factor n=1 Tax=Desulfosporosinus shakirovi TaxID=2885154 RepID=UPI001E5BE21B|nr:sigma-70 family RNA polymerase sigma factor [Desulfosporosinus sp. SRJS8]MCB8818857.1 sigma-70 family RNA polymerase sigma factor [Desulfosporosinus sp. SRJS8]